jgi:hypothetical protein
LNRKGHPLFKKIGGENDFAEDDGEKGWGIPPEREYVFLVAAGDPVRVHWRKAKSKADGMWEVAVEESVQNAPRILRALRLAGLADDGPPGKMDLLLGPGMVSMRREAVFVLAKVLRT